MSSKKKYFIIVVLLMVAGCSNGKLEKNVAFQVQRLDFPFVAGSGEPNLHAGEDGKLYISWVEPIGESEHALRFSFLGDKEWSQPVTIAQGKNWFVNWADFPAFVTWQNGRKAAHWLQKSGPGAYAYDVKIARSNDDLNWQLPVTPHRDGTETEHGFVSMLPWFDDQLFCVWLDGRKYAKSAHNDNDTRSGVDEMTLRFALISETGQLLDEQILDERVCDCCPTDAVKTSDGALVVYRDRSEKEIRDIFIVSYRDGKWSEPRAVFRDNWKIEGCPVNGAAIDAIDAQVVVAWMTMANDTPAVNVTFSASAGWNFGEAIRIDDGNPVGRVDVVLLADHSAAVSWLETTESGAELRVRRVSREGLLLDSQTVAESRQERASGFPKMVYYDHKLFFCWTKTDSSTSVQTAFMELPVGTN